MEGETLPAWELQNLTAVVIDIETRLATEGRILRLIVPATPSAVTSAGPNKALITAIARSVGWYDDLVAGRATSLPDIAIREDVSERYVAPLVPVAFLAPDLVGGCIDGAIDPPIMAADLARGVELPCDWTEQRLRFLRDRFRRRPRLVSCI